MLKVGITGGIGSGKSTVCRLFAMLGIPVYDSDARAKALMATDPTLISGIRELFGPESYSDEGGLELNRRHIAAIAFSNKALLCKLEALVHPTVLRDFAAWVDRMGAGAATAPAAGDPAPFEHTPHTVLPAGSTAPPYILLESAILFESGFDASVDKAILVEAPAQVRIGRVVRRDGASAQSVAERMSSQVPATHAVDFRIDNGGEVLLWPQVLDINKALKQLSCENPMNLPPSR